MLERGNEKSVLREREQQLQTQQQGGRQQRHLSPISQMDRLFDEMFRRPFFSSLWSQRMGGSESEDVFMPVDIYEDKESVVVKAEIPGIRKEDLDIQLTPDSIVISGQKSSEEKVEEKDYFRLERSCGAFSRRFQLPVEINTEQARANFKDGVLEVRIPKSEQAQRVKKLTIE